MFALGAGDIATIDGPLANDTIALSYDELGRSAGQSINGVANTPHYDELGRVDSVTNALGAFGYHFDGVSSRLASVDIPNGQQTTFGYKDNLGDRALSNIMHLDSGGGIVSKFDYVYSAPGRIGEWTQQQGNQPVVKYALGYNDVDELKDATGRDVSTGALVKHYAYDYDAAGNRTAEQIDSLVATEEPNQLNQMTRRTPGGRLKVRGALTEPASVTVNGTPAAVDANNQFQGSVNVGTGDNQLEVVATDGNGNIATQHYQINVPTAAAVTQQYDANGNLMRKATGPNAITYEWDAANRLIAINTGTGRTEFEYDGLNRRVHIVEKESNAVISEKRFVWSALTLAEERDGSANVTKRFFDQGVQVAGGASGGNYYYSRDHLGSIRELIESAGAIRARFDYEPTGRRTRMEGSADADFGFTGHYVHQSSGLYLTPYRAYDAGTARWLSRDPIAESGGLNLYGYVGNSPANRTDPLGLWYWNDPATWFDGGGYEGTSDYSNYRAMDWSEGLYAGLDGLNPFGDPFANNGFYDPCDRTLQRSRAIGHLAWEVETALASAWAFRALGTALSTEAGFSFKSLTMGEQWMLSRGAIPVFFWNSGLGGQAVALGLAGGAGYLVVNKVTNVAGDLKTIFGQ